MQTSLFPRHPAASEVSAAGYHIVIHIAQTKKGDDAGRRQVVMLANPVRDESLGHDVRSEAVNRDGHRLCHTNGVCQLNFHPVRKVCANDVLCDLPRHVGSRAINLGGVFAAEGTAAMSADTAVSIGDMEKRTSMSFLNWNRPAV